MSEILNTEDSFYTILPGSEKAVVKYLLEDGKIYVLSTYTPPEHKGARYSGETYGGSG